MKNNIKLKALSLVLALSTVNAYADKGQEIDDIIKTMSPLIELSLKMVPSLASQKDKMTQKTLEEFSKVLSAEFTDKEITEIALELNAIKGVNLAEVATIFMKATNDCLKKGESLENVDVSFCPELETLFSKKMAKEKIVERVKTIYLTRINKNGQDKDANAFAKKVIQHLKKILLSKFNEQQLIALYKFEESNLGEKVFYSLTKAMQNAAN